MSESTRIHLTELLYFGVGLGAPVALIALYLLYRIVKGHRWRQNEILNTSIAILNTNQAILAEITRATRKETPLPRKAPGRAAGSEKTAPWRREESSLSEISGDPAKNSDTP